MNRSEILRALYPFSILGWSMAVLCPDVLAQVDLSHDTCASAFGPVGEGAYIVDNTGATESGVQPSGLPPFMGTQIPATACDDFGIPGFELDLNVDVWMEFTPSLDRTYVFSTCSTAVLPGWDSKIAIYSGACGSLTPLACNDDGPACPNFGSELWTPVLSAGTNYLVQIGSFSSSTPRGIAELRIVDIPPIPPNDDCVGATPIALGLNVGAIDTTGATNSDVLAEPLPAHIDDLTADTACEPEFPFPALSSWIENDVWFTFRPTVSGDYQFSTCGLTDFATKLAIFSGTCESTIALACNNRGPGCAIATSELRVTNLVANETYYLIVGGAFSGTGDLLVALESGSPGSNYCVAGSNSYSVTGAHISANGSSSASANDLQLFARHIDPGEPCLFYYGPNQIAVAFGDGQRCVGGPPGTVRRLFPFVVADTFGRLTLAVDNTHPVHMPQLQPGMTWNFQAWYRDPAAGASGFNLSDGLQLTFAP